jgi:type IX secretion system PorP/SprF family membrane protein
MKILQNAIITGVLVCIFAVSASSQNDVQYTHFMFNKMGYNAGFAGNNGALTLGGIYRYQWFKVDGAPRTLNVHAHMPFAKDRCGIGLSLTADQIGLFKTTSVELSYAYRLPVGKSTLSLGLSGRLDHGRIDWEAAQGIDPNDGLLPNDKNPVFAPNFGVGAVLSGERYFVGASINQLLNNTYFQYADLANENDFKYRTIYLMGGLDLPLSAKVRFQPSVLASHNARAPFDLDVNAGFVFMDALYAGVSYRLEDSWDLLVGYQITKQLRIGAAYDFTSSDLNTKTAGSVECLLQYTFRYDDMRIKNLRFF